MSSAPASGTAPASSGAPASSLALLATRRLGPLCLSQACGALNDNLVKNALVVLALFRFGTGGAGLVALAGALFIAPYALLSATAGQIADRFDKSRVIQAVKALEVALMAVSAAGFLLGSTPLLLAVLFGLGVQAALFGPVKYGILPDHLDTTEIVAGNGLIEAATFVAILAGTVAGGALVLLESGPAIVAGTGLAISAIGLLAAFAVPPAPAADPGLRIGWNILGETAGVVRLARGTRPVWLSILGLSWFWALGALLLSEFPSLARDTLGADGHVVTLLLTVFSVGVGTGSILCARLLRGEVSARYVPFAALAITVFIWDCGSAANAAGRLADVPAVLASVQGWRMMLNLLLLAVCGGLYSVPLYAIVQEQSEPAHRARTIAANNVVNAVFMVAGAGVVAGLAAAGVSAPGALKVAAAANLLVALWIVRLLPRDVLRSLMRGYFRLFHRVAVRGLENLPPPDQRAVVVVNHQSFLDGCLVAAFLPGELVFAIDTEQARRFRFLSAFLELFPVDPANPMATRAMVKAVRDGRRLAIFPEGRITRTGALMKIYAGPALIADKADAAIVPVRIDGLVFHKTSHMRGKLPLRWFPRVRLTVLPPCRPEIPAAVVGRARRMELGRVLHGIMVAAAFRPETIHGTLFGNLLRARSLYDLGRPVVADIAPGDGGGTTRTALTYDRLILASTVLGRALVALVTEPVVGVLLPNSAGLAVTFFGLQAQGRTVAMLNVASGAEAVLSCCAAAGVGSIVSSRRFIEKGRLHRLVDALSTRLRFVWLEDVRAAIGLGGRLRGMVAAWRPQRLPGATGDGQGMAVVLFTSGSEGAPKGVALSHRALLANCAQAAAIIDFNPADRVFNALPMFHAFGLTAGTLLPLLYGVRTFLYPSPLHYKAVPEMVYDDQSTILFGTDSFLGGYARRGEPMDFQSLRYIFAGAEKVRPETRQAYMARFGKPIFEGYGATETGPVLALNTLAAAKEGSVGQFLPGILHRLEPVPGIEGGGRLLVKGPNVMLGYLKADRPGVPQAPPDGWYDTGDIVSVDAQGFVTILGRAKRFAKIAGEMVSLGAAEALAHSVWPDAAQAVVALPDARKGERLVLVTTQPDAAPRAMLAKARASGIAEIMVAREVLVVAKLPLLGSGKTDYPAVVALAAGRAAEAVTAD
ncbi:acyl-[ACP]--phospholipid O-acyltransferase [Rhodopila sp.]|jgi:acyl-[acyl-carrier-protein]-phospholipid O-acyltransferase/long-chain-fatty-acid--[acyl-carrier-protein] ligase|uniref:acyl-[ACP]--phospholipid O-acyltransferase n=1 Tax=Rhodopila sp. TaxID=2480087 RepID=UPI002C6D6414|nr:acyl-[ACP]--phospholipid O-acyltransferase [Rhodopila sp.]HVZ07458.1 acyl-[ACP]--phospholipid O-acyltransferase [Rhodopila sp.]